MMWWVCCPPRVRKLLDPIEAEEEFCAPLSCLPVTIFLRIVLLVRPGACLDRAQGAHCGECRPLRRAVDLPRADPGARAPSRVRVEILLGVGTRHVHVSPRRDLPHR